jgi:hypothetical protein
MGFCERCQLNGSICSCGGSKRDIGLQSTPNQTLDALLSLGFRGGAEIGLKIILYGDDSLKCYGCAKLCFPRSRARTAIL